MDRVDHLAWIAGSLRVVHRQAVDSAPIILPAPVFPGACRLRLDMRRGVRGRKLFIAVGTAGRGALAEASSACTGLKEGFPGCIDFGELNGERRESSHERIGVIQNREHAAVVAVRVGVVAKTRVPEGIAVGTLAVFAVALFHDDHRCLTTPFPDGLADRGTRLPKVRSQTLHVQLAERK
jgi:hypothetical protein